MQMNGINELIDIAHHYPRWSDPRLVVLVLNNRDLNQVNLGAAGARRRPEARGLAGPSGVSVRALRRAARPQGHPVDSPEQVAGAWDEALAADRPVVYEAITDPEQPPLPPHVRMEQATSMAKALLGATRTPAASSSSP